MACEVLQIDVADSWPSPRLFNLTGIEGLAAQLPIELVTASGFYILNCLYIVILYIYIYMYTTPGY